ncbi:MAG: tetratricopeptide repeat-containing sulfotransferase family protein, partial [Gammaproteobacteria bacterium]
LYRQILQSQPENPQALNLLGVLLAQSRQDYGEAERLITQAIGIDPGVAEYHNNLGLTLQQQGKYKEAAESFRCAINLKGDFAMAWFGLGNVSVRLKDATTAIKSYQKVIAIKPGFFQALNNLGNVYREIGNYEKARQYLDQTLALKPDFAAGWYNLGLLFKVMQDGGNAVAAFSKAIELNQAYFQAYIQRGLCYSRLLNDIDSALKDCDRILEVKPDSVGAHLVKATAYQEAGRFNEAESELRKALALDASSLEAYLGLVITRKYNEQDMAKIKDLLEDVDLHEHQVSFMHFSMARILDERGDYEQAFRHLLQGNVLHRKTYEFDVKEVEQSVTMLTDTFTAGTIRGKTGQGLDTDVPVFIVGMPRSGTTLTEQIIASHPEAFGAGELALISMIAGEVSYKGFGKYPECVFKLPPAELAQQAERYLAGIRKLNGTARRITDKMTHNFLHVGLISLLFPRAVIIHCQRHP